MLQLIYSGGMYEPSLDEMSVGQWVRHRRRALGLTQTAVAELAGMAQSNLAAIETGRRGVGPATAQRLRDVLAATPGDILRLNREGVLEAARRHRVRDVRVFGSVARGEDVQGDSDIDLLATMPTDDVVGAYLGFTDDVSRLLTVPVDVVPDTPGTGSDVLAAARREALPL